MYKKLNPLLHAGLRLAIINLLMKEKQSEFSFIMKETNTTPGNLSVQLNKLNKAGYIEVTKQFKGSYPQTVCKITHAGMEAFNDYVNALKPYISIETAVTPVDY